MIKKDCPMEEYFKLIRSVRPAVLSLTEKRWDIRKNFDKKQEVRLPPAGYPFMVYLRHHGFPSPLLDWTRSPYVAAFFAFRSPGDRNDSEVAIYSYIEYQGGARSFSDSEATMFEFCPYVVTHKRHYAQQCHYTICRKRVADGYVYTNHENAVSENQGRQDNLIKYTLPKSERGKVLKSLELMNITAFSLFGNEESLMETLAYHELERHLLQK
jgi:hypothetical protein